MISQNALGVRLRDRPGGNSTPHCVDRVVARHLEDQCIDVLGGHGQPVGAERVSHSLAGPILLIPAAFLQLALAVRPKLAAREYVDHWPIKSAATGTCRHSSQRYCVRTELRKRFGGSSLKPRDE